MFYAARNDNNVVLDNSAAELPECRLALLSAGLQLLLWRWRLQRFLKRRGHLCRTHDHDVLVEGPDTVVGGLGCQHSARCLARDAQK